MSEFELRAGAPSDRAYVLRSWFEGARRTFWAGAVAQVFFEEHGRAIESALDRSVCRIAHVVGEPDAILGFAVLEPERSVLHWVHVRKLFRGTGMARAMLGSLLREPLVYCTHWPEGGRAPSHFRFNPYRLMRGDRAA
jgi:hypothetical protein